MIGPQSSLLKRWFRDTRARFLLGGAISLLLGWLSVRGIDWDLVVAQFQEFPVAWAVLSMIVVVVANILRACRWQALFVSQRLPLMRLFVVQNAGIGLNNLVPIRVVSEGVQFALLTLRYRVKPGGCPLLL